jgi:DNA repair exonuclease SbcCD nuclease subunit
MSRIGTLVHAADLHLGSPLQSLGGSVGDEQAKHIRMQSIKAFDRLIDMTIERQADVLVLAGDVYDSAEKEPRAQLQFAFAMEKLKEAGVRVFIAHGNHDPVITGFKPAASLPDNVVVFEPDTPQIHRVALRSGSELQVAGVSFGQIHETENLAKRFLRLSCDVRRTVGVLHTNVGSNALHGDYAPCTPEDLEAAPVGYWALGHIHARSVTAMAQGRWWAYPGNMQGRSTKATECGPKGALVVPILDEGFGQPEFLSCDTVRFAREDVDVSEAINLQDVVHLVDDRLMTLEDEANGRPVVARVRVRGATEAHHQLI